jgi:uncharacterized protein YcbK (DUF882 family)
MTSLSESVKKYHLGSRAIDINVDSVSLFDLRVILEEASLKSNGSISNTDLAETVNDQVTSWV